MKKKYILAVVIVVVLIVGFFAVRYFISNNHRGIEKRENQGNVKIEAEQKVLVAYFSHSGNTRRIAEIIQEDSQGDLFEIATVNPYPSDYNECVKVASKEKRNNARPKLSSHVEDFDKYDVIFIGYPSWWQTCPMAVFTFMEEYDFSNKIIIPFTTHGGSSWGKSLEDMKEVIPNATIAGGISIYDKEIDAAENEVKEWMDTFTS